MIKNGAEVDAVDKKGETPLHKAPSHHETKAMEVLLQNGANVNAVNNDGKTALHASAVWGKSLKLKFEMHE